MADEADQLRSVCVYCGSSDAADPDFLAEAAAFGRALAAADIRLVYGGGGVGLMGACARAAHEAGGRVYGVIPQFLIAKERAYDEVETTVVTSMHERKMILFDEADAFVVMPGGIGTLEEIVELLSWQRLALHRKPVAFYSPKGFWDPLFALFEHTVKANLTPPEFMGAWRVFETIDPIIPALRAMCEANTGPDAHPEAAERT